MSLNNIKSATLTAIVLIATALFSGLLYREYLALQKYIIYIAENGKSALFYEQYINQRIAFRLSTLFTSPRSRTSTGDLCLRLEQVNGMYGLNLDGVNVRELEGTLQTRDKACRNWISDIAALMAIDDGIVKTSRRFSFANYNSYTFSNSRYYLDFEHNYIYSALLLNARRFRYPTWLTKGAMHARRQEIVSSLNIPASGLAYLLRGRSATSLIHRDPFSGRNTFNLICPVFTSGSVKGIVLTNVEASDLATAFYTADRPLLWSSLSLSVSDGSSGRNIVFHLPWAGGPQIVRRSIRLNDDFILHINVPLWYFCVSNLWLLALYTLTTLLLCQYASYQLSRRRSLLRDNVTDALTGLYNRKLLTGAFRRKIGGWLQRRIAITMIAIDCDGLKKINDTLGHHAGDRAIFLLGSAIAGSIRKSDYAIRAGGDEFMLILVDTCEEKALRVVLRIEEKLKESEAREPVAFSWGSYQMAAGDALEEAFIRADRSLYQHKYAKKASR